MRLSVFSRIFTLLCVLLLYAEVNITQAASSAEAAAQESAAMKAEVDGKVQALLKAPPGVFDVEYENGQLMRLKIKGESEVLKLHPTTRFSPGFGDFDIVHQRDILALLDCQKRIGLTLTDSNMLCPTKSVTAVVGFRG